MRIDDGLALDPSVAGHVEQLGGVLEIADVSDVGAGVDPVSRHEAQGLGDVPGPAARGAR